jgi:hypothetical protein
MILALDRRMHQPCSFGLLRTLQRRFPAAAQELMGYRHAYTGNFVVCRWVSRTAHLVTELASAPRPDAFEPGIVQEIGFMLSRKRLRSFRAWSRNMASAHRAALRKQAEELQQGRDIVNFARSRLNIHKRDDPTRFTGVLVPCGPNF